jgi:hypothetical protein
VLVAKTAKVDSIFNLTVTDAQSADEIADLLGKSVATASTGQAKAKAIATGMAYGKLNALATGAAKLADDVDGGVTGDMYITSDVIEIGALLGKTSLSANVTVNATGMSDSQLAQVSANIAKVDTFTSVSVTSALTAEQLTVILTNSTNVTANATGMVASQLNALAANASSLAANGVTGTMLVNSGVTDSDLGALLGKTSVSATVNVDATGMTATGLSAVAANDSKIYEISNLSLTSAQTASEITTLLGKSVAAASTGKAMAVADATSMDVSKLNALGNSYAKLAANGITGDVALSGGSSGVRSGVCLCSCPPRFLFASRCLRAPPPWHSS